MTRDELYAWCKERHACAEALEWMQTVDGDARACLEQCERRDWIYWLCYRALPHAAELASIRARYAAELASIRARSYAELAPIRARYAADIRAAIQWEDIEAGITASQKGGTP